jgi:ABC-2 type transport system permease protein
MVAATAYIMACSAKNRVRRRLRRLREPRYLLGALVGTAYLWFAFFGRASANRFASGRRRRATRPPSFLPAFGATGPAIGGWLLLAAAAASWVMPVQSRLLEFSAAETELLFPAPVSRRQLLLYRIVRAQWAVLFSSLIIALTYPSASLGTRIRGFIGSWLVLMTSHVFFTGITLTRTAVPDRSLRARLLAWSPRVVLAGILTISAYAIGSAVARRPIETAREAVDLLTSLSSGGILRIVLWPFAAVLEPLFAQSFSAFALALPASLAIYAVLVAWVLSADEAFGVLADTMAEERPRTRAGRPLSYRARAPLWNIAVSGRFTETVFIWKAALQSSRVIDRRVLLRGAIIVAWVTITAALLSRARGLAQVLGMFAAFAAAFTVIVGPQILRLDLRQDLHHLELLKTWPVRSAAIVRGEMLWPAFVVAITAWSLGAIGLFLSAAVFSRTGMSLRLALGWSGMILAAPLILAQYTIHNGIAVLFPAWIVTGSVRPRGVDAMGQRMIILGGAWLVLIVAVLPGVVIGGVLWMAFYRFIGPWVLVPGALITALIIFVEVTIATEAIGAAYERLDITSVERAE